MITMRKFDLKISHEQIDAEYPLDVGVTDPEIIVRVAKALLGDNATETIYVFFMDAKNKIIGYSHVGVGGVDTCPVDVKHILRMAITAGASSLILAHNHPSGDVTPSKEDAVLTQRLSQAAKIVGLNLLDHVVVSRNEYYSFAAHNETNRALTLCDLLNLGVI